MSESRKTLVFLICLQAACPLAQAGFQYFDPADTLAVPKTLSQTGLYADIVAKRMIAEAVRFDVNTPQWSDGSVMTRWILLKRNASVTFREMDDYWDYPDSTVFIQQFALDTVAGESASRVLWETRLLLNRKEHPNGDSALPKADSWYGYSYKWRRDQADADLVSVSGGTNDTVRVHPPGRGTPPAWKKRHFPARHECRKCHVPTLATTQARSILGFFTAQLNRRYWRGAGHQLDTLFARGVLKGTKADWYRSPRWYGVHDSALPGQSVDKRARAYLAANCSGCHGARGNANQASAPVSFVLDYHAGMPQDSFNFRTVRRGDFVADVEPLDVAPGLAVPGYPQKSLLHYRQAQRNTTPGDFTPDSREMPPLAGFEPDEDALKLIARWIREMDTARVAVRPSHLAGSRGMAVLQGRVLVLPLDWGAPGAPDLVMTGIQGRSWRIAPSGPGRYLLPEGMPRGVYALRVDARVPPYFAPRSGGVHWARLPSLD